MLCRERGSCVKIGKIGVQIPENRESCIPEFRE